MSTALVIMDYQNGIVAQLPDPGKLLDAVAGAIDTARSHGAYVGFVRVAFTHAEYDAVPGSNKGFTAAKASGRDFRDDSHATAVCERIAPREGDIMVRKIRVGAFSTTDLHGRLRERGVDTLVLAGISTSGVVLSTLRDAADRDYRLFVLSDACADPNADVHAFLMEKICVKRK